MPFIQCGAAIRYPGFDQGTAGCLVRFRNTPNRVLLMTVGHAVLPSYAKQNDAIYAVDLPGVVLGMLRTWTNFQDTPTADAALIWVDPTRVSPNINCLGVPTTFNTAPQIGDALRIVPAPGQSTPRETRIEQIGDVDLLIPAWAKTVSYRNQLLCRPVITVPGDGGAIAVNAQNRVVGMVLGGADSARAIHPLPRSRPS